MPVQKLGHFLQLFLGVTLMLSGFFSSSVCVVCVVCVCVCVWCVLISVICFFAL